MQLLKILAWLLKKFDEDPKLVNSSDRRAFTNKCLDVMAAYFTDLESLQGNDVTGKALIVELRGLQTRFNRIVGL